MTLTYDEVENEATTPGVVKRRPGRPRKDESATKAPAVPAGNKRGRDEDSVTSAPSKKGGAASSSSATHKGGAAQATSSSRGGGSAGEDKDNEASSKNKARYPDIAFKFTGTGSGKSSKSHTDILTAVVADICKAERVGLEKFFKANPGPGRDDILAVLKQVLADLPTEIASKCPADAEFEPEFGRGERGEVEMLTSVLSTLKEQSDALARYEQNIGLLGNDQGLWITSDHVPKSSGAAGGSSPTKRGQGDTVRGEKNRESIPNHFLSSGHPPHHTPFPHNTALYSSRASTRSTLKKTPSPLGSCSTAWRRTVGPSSKIRAKSLKSSTMQRACKTAFTRATTECDTRRPWS